MKAAMLGMSGSGRKTLMQALVSQEHGPVQAGKKTLVTIPVPDARVDYLSKSFRPEKTTYATVEMLLDDTGQDSMGKRLSAARHVEVFVLVAGAFGLGSDSAESALQDADQFLEEMLLADLMVVERRLELLVKKNETGPERRLLERAKAALDDSRPLRELVLIDAEEQILQPYSLLTMKPVIVAVNIEEEELENPVWDKVEELLRRKGTEPMTLCASLEREVAELAPEEQLEYLEAIGLPAPASHRLVQSVYRALDLISSFTVGEDEVRAWPVRKGSPAPVAGGKIHSDIQKGFIRAEVVSFDDFKLTGSLARARKTGRLHTEGKTYIIKDGDIAHFLFNV